MTNSKLLHSFCLAPISEMNFKVSAYFFKTLLRTQAHSSSVKPNSRMNVAKFWLQWTTQTNAHCRWNCSAIICHNAAYILNLLSGNKQNTIKQLYLVDCSLWQYRLNLCIILNRKFIKYTYIKFLQFDPNDMVILFSSVITSNCLRGIKMCSLKKIKISILIV